MPAAPRASKGMPKRARVINVSSFLRESLNAFNPALHPNPREEVSRIRARLAQLESQEEQLEEKACFVQMPTAERELPIIPNLCEKANSVRKRRQDPWEGQPFRVKHLL